MRTVPSRLRPVRRGRRAAATVEFALIALIFIQLIIAALEVNNMMSRLSSIEWVTATTSRSVMVSASPTTAGVRTQLINTAASVGITAAMGATFNATQAACSATSATQCMILTVTVPYRFNLATFGLVQITLRARARAPYG